MDTDLNKEGLSKANSMGARRRGRPPGSKNRAKQLVAINAVNDLKAKLAPYLPVEDLDYLTGVLDGTSNSELQKDMDIFLALQLKALLPQLADEIKTGSLTREATQRSSTVKELLALRFQMEKHEKGDERNDQYTFIQNIFDARGLDTGRMAELLGLGASAGQPAPATPRQLPGVVSGNADGDARPADEAGAVSGEVLERPVEVPAGSEE